jgi:psp operon transcriptional activator
MNKEFKWNRDAPKPRISSEVNEALGQSEKFLEFQERLSMVAPINRPVLLIGERGTGKELAASRLHYLSGRWHNPLVTLNCSALNPSLIETELFGYEKGAFTGAFTRRTGRFEAATGGTLFLDEIGTIPLEVQEKILRVVEYGTFERVGSTESIEVDVRIIAATNADLPFLAAKGQFKQDLLDRLSFEVLMLPPLRERKEDILLLAHHFAARMAFELGWVEVPVFSDDAVSILESHLWPGNVRELKNVVERAVYRSDSFRITEIIYNPFSPSSVPDSSSKILETSGDLKNTYAPYLRKKPFSEAVREFEIRLLKEALVENKYNQQRTALTLGISYHQFRGLYRKYKEELA